ncbi:MAG TPA: hypothetical protein VFI79_13930 [Gemmatimonadales bacterium]|nr:hypothetical protein [Gemmatimonadales bacterium]
MSAPANSRRCLYMLFSASLSLLHPTTSGATPFYSTMPNPAPHMFYNSLAIDSRGTLHIAFQDVDNLDLMYAEVVHGVWAFEVVDSVGDVGEYPSMCLDHEGTPVITYYDNTNHRLRYAKRIAHNAWDKQTVDNTGDVGKYSSCAVDLANDVDVTYYDATNGDLKEAGLSNGTWTTTTVDAGGDVGRYSALAVDHLGFLHVSYYDVTNHALKYASNYGNWSIETVDHPSPGAVGLYTSLALDSSDRPYITYYDELNGRLKLASEIGTAWSLEVVDSSARVGLYSSLTLTSADAPTVAYMDSTSRDAKFASKASGSWIIEQMTPARTSAGHEVGRNMRLVLDVMDNPVAAYADSTGMITALSDSRVVLTDPHGGSLWQENAAQGVTWLGSGPVQLAISTDGGLTYDTVASSLSGNSFTVIAPGAVSDEVRVKLTRDSPLSVSESGPIAIVAAVTSLWWNEIGSSDDIFGNGPSLRLAANGVPHVSYYDHGNKRLKYGRRIAGAWFIDNVDTCSAVATLALDNQDAPHVAYLYRTNSLHHAYKTGPTTWATEQVDSNTTSAGIAFPCIAADNAGDPAVAYKDLTQNDLKYAHRSGAGWVVETVDTAGNVGSYPSLAFDGRGNPHIAYGLNAGPVGKLRYAHKYNGNWITATVDSMNGALVGRYPSIAIDPMGNPHIAYEGTPLAYDATTASLLYATLAGGDWSSELVEDVLAGTGSDIFPSLAFASDGKPHIAYYSNVLQHTYKDALGWHDEVVSTETYSGFVPSIAIDADGMVHIAHSLYDNSDPDHLKYHFRYSSSAVELSSPAPGASWPVAARRSVVWDGGGLVDVALSTDGGLTYSTMATGVGGGRYQLTVPNVGSDAKYCKVKITRAVPKSVAVSDSFFTITAYVSAGVFSITLGDEGSGAWLQWTSDPAPADLAGFIVRASGDEAAWQTVMPLARVTQYFDPAGREGEYYRLYSVNNAGTEQLIGQERLAAPRMIRAYPVPFGKAGLTVELHLAAKAELPADVAVYDIAGRRIATILHGQVTSARTLVPWNGLDAAGLRCRNGVYFIRAEQGGKIGQDRAVLLR